LAFKSFDCECLGWRLWHKRVVCTKSDIYMLTDKLYKINNQSVNPVTVSINISNRVNVVARRGNQNRKSKKNRQYNDQTKKYKRTNNDLQNIHIKLKIESHEPHLNQGWTQLLSWSGRVSDSFSTSGNLRVNLITNPVISHEWEKDTLKS
jgi:hypothetical protein